MAKRKTDEQYEARLIALKNAAMDGLARHDASPSERAIVCASIVGCEIHDTDTLSEQLAMVQAMLAIMMEGIGGVEDDTCEN